MTIQHNIITDPDIHEPKGVATATSGKVYKANGLGSGSWLYPVTGQDTALAGQVFQSDGSGGGAWVYPPAKGHAEIYLNAGTATHLLGAGSSYTKLNPTGGWTDSGFTDIITVDAANGEIVLGLEGHYQINFWINFTTASLSSGTQYRFKFAIDGTTSLRTVTVDKPTNGTDTLHTMATGLVGVTAGQRLSIYAAGDATSSATLITPKEAGLTAMFLD